MYKDIQNIEYGFERDVKFKKYIVTVVKKNVRIFAVERENERHYFVYNSNDASRFSKTNNNIKVFDDYKKALKFYEVTEKVLFDSEIEIEKVVLPLKQELRNIQKKISDEERKFYNSLIKKVENSPEYLI